MKLKASYRRGIITFYASEEGTADIKIGRGVYVGTLGKVQVANELFANVNSAGMSLMRKYLKTLKDA